ncbi:MAG: NADH-dependent [FeFe] hydrogenase, group A6 [Acidobacteriota bacterium]|nr:NADH-dependent [FeFe] hydrogenase, group A6 [Acidobacteriota bacterium]
MTSDNFVTIDGRQIPIEGEPNLLEVCRKANIDIPTFCYHSDLSVYGACRLCIVDIEGRGIVTSCSTAPEPGMVLRTNTEEIREMRKIAVELLLANHDQSCPTCARSSTCKLQGLARRLGIQEVRFKRTAKEAPIDRSSPSLVRDPNKCVLCGDCVRMCSEIQGIGAIDFANRGSQVTVGPAFGKELSGVECVYCGQCAAVCPTGAITPKSDVDDVWKVLEDPTKIVVAQIAPAVRVALGECFGLDPGVVTIGQIVAGLRAMGFDRVYDTCFAADLTVIEEGTEFLKRFVRGERMPQFTSCCPGWVKFAEQYCPDMLPNLSSCRSPQQMFGSLAKDVLPAEFGCEAKDLVVVSIMPCTAKKFEATRPEFERDSVRDVDFVLTTQELAQMIEGAGLQFGKLQPESLDLPMGFKTGAGVIFGNSGGVSEAVLRYAAEQVSGVKIEAPNFEMVRGTDGVREATINIAGHELRLAIVHGLGNARKLVERIRSGECEYHLVEVMACPGGCIGGAGQPIATDANVKARRTEGLYMADKMLQLHKSQENPYVAKAYETTLGEVGGEKAHSLLHTHYHSRKRIADEDIPFVTGEDLPKVRVRVCVGTSCFVRGSQELLKRLIGYIEENGLTDRVDVGATFCLERCNRGPSVAIGEEVFERCSFEQARDALAAQLGVVEVG